MTAYLKLLLLTPFLCAYLLPAYGSSSDTVEDHPENEKIRYFDLPVQPLAIALMEFAIQSNTSLIFEDNIDTHYTSSPVVGAYKTNEALTLLLNKSPFQYRYIKKGAVYIIERKKSVASSTSIEEEKHTQSEPIEELVIKGTQFPYRYHTITSTQVHMGLSIYDSSRFINAIPEALASDQNANNLISILRLGSGITPGDGLANTNDDYYIRGFPRFGLYLDGYRLDGSSGFQILPSNIERVEILKGPSTLLYGQAEPGGIVNVIRKGPKNKKETHITIASGSEGKKQATLDTMNFSELGQGFLSYRLIYDNDRYNTFLDAQDFTRELISPSLHWYDGKRTNIGFSLDYQESALTRNQGTITLAPIGDEINFVSLDTPPHQARPNFTSKFILSKIDFSHFLSNSWVLNGDFFLMRETRQGVRANQDSILFNTTLVTAEDLAPEFIFIIFPGGILVPIREGTEIGGNNGETITTATIQSLYDESSNVEGKFLKLRFEGSPNFFDDTHHISTGIDIRKHKTEERYTLEERDDIESIEALNSDAISVTLHEDGSIGELSVRSQEITFRETGIFFKDAIELNDKLISTIGARYTHTSGDRFTHLTQKTEALPTFTKLSSDLGFVYKRGALNYYLNYSESMKANYQLDDTGTNIDKPELSNQVELGLKGFLLSNKLSYTLGIYHIQKENVVNVEFFEGRRTNTLSEAQKSKGIDFDFSSQIKQNLNIVGSYSYNDTRISQGVFKGNNPPLVSDETASIFAHKEILFSSTQKINYSIGGFFINDRFGNNENSDIINAYTTLNFGASYEYKSKNHKHSLHLDIKNITDKEHITSAIERVRNNTGGGRLFEISIKSSF